VRRTGDAYMRPDLTALRAAMQRASAFSFWVELPAHPSPDAIRHLLDAHNWFLILANYVVFAEARAADLRGK
jgi:hypothetical protein